MKLGQLIIQPVINLGIVKEQEEQHLVTTNKHNNSMPHSVIVTCLALVEIWILSDSV